MKMEVLSTNVREAHSVCSTHLRWPEMRWGQAFLEAATAFVVNLLLCGILGSGEAPAATSHPLSGSELTSRPSPTDVSNPASWQIPHGSDPINGSQPDTRGVNLFRGEFTPQVPLAVLPARSGLAPDLTLVYSAQRGDTALGSGWQFGFMSNIERRAVGGGTPDMYGVLNDPGPNSEFRVDGALLVPNPTGDGTYRSEHDTFTIYEPKVHWVIVNRVMAWEVRRNGITRTYGSSASAGFCQDGVEYATADCAEPVRWYLTQIKDAHGNVIVIKYDSFWRNDVSFPTDVIHRTLEARTKRLLERRFSGQAPQIDQADERQSSGRSVGPPARDVQATDRRTRTPRPLVRENSDAVFFNDTEQLVIGGNTHKLLPITLSYNDSSHVINLIYETRPDIRSERQDGIERTLLKRVSHIDVKTIRDGTEHLAYRYRLEYKQAAADGRSLLTELRQEAVDAGGGAAPESVTLRRFEYADKSLSDLAWGNWAPLNVTGMSLVPDHYEFSDEIHTKAYSSVSMLVNVDTDAQPDLIVLNTDCEADPPKDPPKRGSGSGHGGGGLPGSGDVVIVDVDIDVFDIPRTALSICKSHHRVFLNESDGTTGRKFVYDSLRSDQLNKRLGPLQQVTGPVTYLIVDIDGNGIADLVLGNIDNGQGSLARDSRYYAGSEQGWTGEGLDLPWTISLGGRDPFRELQLTDVNGDGKPDLAGDRDHFLNSGTAPFFSADSSLPLQIYGAQGNLKNLPTDLPPANPESKCMARDASARFARTDLGIHHSFSADSYRGTEDLNDAVGPEKWVWRHTSYSDFNGDGVADRIVALSWPEEAEIVRDIGSTLVWQDAQGRCGGINRVYLGNGRGEFFQTDMSIGGLYAWPGGPRAAHISHNEVQTAPAVTFEYNPPVNHQSEIDFNGDGRAEMTQVCSTGWAHAIADVGSEAKGYGLAENSTQCPDGSVSLPAMWNGSSGALPPFIGSRDDAVLGGYFDIDGNGMADGFVAANPVNPSDSAKAGGDQPYWRKSSLTTPQSRLTGILGPYGGRTSLHWSVTSDGGQGGARLLPVIGSIEGSNGRTDFRFSSPVFESGRFIGFQHTEAWGTSGIINVSQFSTDRRRRGAVEYEAVHREDGSLYRLTVQLDRTASQRVALDPVPPFFNPVYRTCTFEFENDSKVNDPSSFIQECSDFDGKEGPRGSIVIGPSTTAILPLKSLLRKHDADSAASPTRRKHGGSMTGKLPLRSLAPGGDILRAQPNIRRSKPSKGTTNGKPRSRKAAPEIDIGSPILRTDNRLRITEFGWDELSGVLLEERAFKDVTTTADSTVSTYTYHPWNEALAVSRLHTRRTREVGTSSASAAGRADSAEREIGDGVVGTPNDINFPATRRHFEYPLEDYIGTEWGREIQWAVTPISQVPPRKRSRTRSFNKGALVQETAWGEERVVSFTYDQCGLISRRSTALGWNQIERDAICRETRNETNHGRRQRLTYDGLNRVRSQVIDIVHPELHRSGSLRFDYDPQAATNEPVEVEIKADASGGETIAKNYVDEFGRSWKRVVCERKPGSADTWSVNLEQAYLCADDLKKIATTISLYDALSGLEGFRSLPFSVAEGTAILGTTATHPGLVPAVQLTGVAGTRTQHDRHGRLRQQTLPDGRLIDYSFDLGRETTVGDGLTIDLLQRDVHTTLLRNGTLINSSRLNAFDEPIEEGDALGNVTSHGFDSWGRRISTTTPEAEVWEKCEGPPVRKRATERATYSDNDEVLTMTDALGNRITKRYDRHGRVLEIVGPDQVVQETRIYDDAYDLLIQPDIDVIDLPIDLLSHDRGPNQSRAPDKPDKPQLRPRSVQTLDSMGNTYTLWIDALDRGYRARAPDGTETLTVFDDRGRESRRTMPTGEIVTMTYDWLDRPVMLALDSGTATAIESREYDVRGNLLRALDTDGEVRQSNYDVMSRLQRESLGNPAKRTPLTVVQNVYDEHGRIAETLLNGVRTAFRYDEAGRLVRKLVGYDPDARTTALMRQDLTYTSRDQVESSTDKRGEGVRSVFDERGRVVARETLFNGKVIGRVETGYDLLGRPVRTVDELRHVTCHRYDEYGRVTASTPPGLGTRKIEYTRNAAHPVTGEQTHSQRTRIIAPTGETVDTYVDAMGRTWLTGNTASGYQQIIYAGGRPTRSERIGLNGVVAAVKLYEYTDHSTRIAREWDWLDPSHEAACVANPKTCTAGSVSFTYTAGGRRLSQADAAGNATITRYADDGSMLPIGMSAAGVTELRFEYDPTYPVVTAKERGPVSDAIRTEFGFDRYLHQIRTDTQRRTTGEREHADYAYDDSGHRLSASLLRNSQLESQLSWTYDEYGRTKTKTYKIAGNIPLTPRTSHRIEWGYTPTGRLAFVKYPSSNQATYRYDADGHLERIESGFGPGSTLIAAFKKPDPSGRYLEMSISKDLRIKHRYKAGRESERAIETRNGLFEEAYRYDALGRLQTTKRTRGAGGAEALTFGYDARSLLTQETVTHGTDRQSYRYTHDALARRTSKVSSASADVVQTYEYIGGNRLLSVNGDTQSAAVWDAYGRPANDHRHLAFEWGLSDQLRAIVLPDGRREAMLFDTDGQRIARTVDGAVDLFYSSDLSGDVYSQRHADGRYLDVVRDPNGGVVALLTGDGKIVPWAAGKGDAITVAGKANRAVQSAFGESSASDLSVELGFHQMWSSALAPLRFAGVRVYDPEIGRFLTPDPLGVSAASDPNDAVDPFRYAHNNPVAVRDSTGYLGITPPTPTTIIVDGIRVETYNVNSWGNGTIRVANQAAYIAGVRAGIKYGIKKLGMSLDEAVEYAVGDKRRKIKDPKSGGASAAETSGHSGPPALGLQLFFQKLFARLSGAGAATPVEVESEAHTQAAGQALEQARGGGPANGRFVNENGKIVRQVSGADPTSSTYWLHVNGPSGEEVLGADTKDVITNFFAENPDYTAAGRIFEAGDVQEISVEGNRMPGIVRFGSGLLNGVRGAIIEPGYLAVDVVDWFMHKATGRARPFEPWSGLWNATNSYKSRGHSYPSAIFNVVADGAFYGTMGALLGIDEGFEDGDWYSVGQHTFALGATVGGAALSGARAGLAAPTTRSAVLGGIAIESSDATTIMMARRGRTFVESQATEVERILNNPLILRDAAGKPRGVFFGPERMDDAAMVRKWMDDGILQDSLHIGGLHGDGRTGFSIKLGETQWLNISATQLARAVDKAVPGTSLTYDHLISCCAAGPGGGAGLFAQLRGRLVLGYDEIVGINDFGRYISIDVRGLDPGDAPVTMIPGNQYMILLDPMGAHLYMPFRGMRSSGWPSNPRVP
jgi:RHS repeat-associated protein